MAREGRLRVNEEDVEKLREAKRIWYGDDVAEEIPDGKAVRDFSKFIIKDQGPPPEEVVDD